MNADTGIAYRLGEDIFEKVEVGERISFDTLPDRPLTAEEMAAAVDDARGEAIVRIEERAAQRLRLGDRELRRRKQRRR